jgi:hypothetical protein
MQTPLLGDVIHTKLGYLNKPLREERSPSGSNRTALVSAAKAASTRCPFCPPPAGGRQPIPWFLPPLRSGITSRPIRRVAARRPELRQNFVPRSSSLAIFASLDCFGLPRAALPSTWRWWRTLRYIRSSYPPLFCGYAATNTFTF